MRRHEAGTDKSGTLLALVGDDSKFMTEMKHKIVLASLLLAVLLFSGCSAVSFDDWVRKEYPDPGQQKMVIAIHAANYACKQFDATSVKVCQAMEQQLALLPDARKTSKAILSDPPGQLSKDEQKVIDNFTLLGAAYFDLVKANRAAQSAQRNQEAFQWGALTGALLAPPSRQAPNCQITNAHTPNPLVQCY